MQRRPNAEVILARAPSPATLDGRRPRLDPGRQLSFQDYPASQSAAQGANAGGRPSRSTLAVTWLIARPTLIAFGRVERDGGAMNLLVERLVHLELGEDLQLRSRDFR